MGVCVEAHGGTKPDEGSIQLARDEWMRDGRTSARACECLGAHLCLVVEAMDSTSLLVRPAELNAK